MLLNCGVGDTTFDFPAFGWKISEFVQGWFEELDGNRIGTTISEAIKGVLDMAISFMSNDAMWTEFVEDIAGILNNIDWYGIFVRVLTLGTKIISALGTVIKTAITGTSSSSNSLTNSYYSAISSQAGSSSVASRIASEMQNANKDTVGFGQQLTDSIASSIRSADTTSIANAIVELFNEITILLGGVVYELGMTLGVKLAEGISNELIGGHWDEDGNWVSANHIGGYGSAYLANRANQRNTVTTQSGGNNQRTTQTSTSRTSAWSTPKPTGKAYSYNDDAKSASRAGTIITKTYNNIASSATKSFTIQKNGFESLSKAVSDGTSVMTEAVSLFGDKMNGDVVAKITSSKNAISATITSLSEDTKFKMNDMTNSVIGSISNADKAIVTPMANIKNTITNGFKEAGTESIKAINEMGSKMSGALDGAISASKETVSGYKGVWDGLKGSVKDTSNSVIAGSESMANGVTTAFNGIIRNLKNFRVKIPDIGDNKDAGKEFDFTHLKELEKISIPRLAKGGIISSPTTALIGEAGKEAVVPLENNTGWIDNLADRLGGDGEEIALLREEVNLLRTIAGKSFTISSREVFNAVREENADYITMTGKNALVM